MLFSLCIPLSTTNVPVDFITNHLPNYLQESSIAEIIITDDSGGKHVDEIHQTHPKLHKHRNDTVLGKCINTLKACSMATQEWIVVTDPSIIMGLSYFERVRQYLTEVIKDQTLIMLRPNRILPDSDYSLFAGKTYQRGFFDSWFHKTQFREMLDQGNFILHSSLIRQLQCFAELEKLQTASTQEILYVNMLLFEKYDLFKMHVVQGLECQRVEIPPTLPSVPTEKQNDFCIKLHHRFDKLYKSRKDEAIHGTINIYATEMVKLCSSFFLQSLLRTAPSPTRYCFTSLEKAHVVIQNFHEPHYRYEKKFNIVITAENEPLQCTPDLIVAGSYIFKGQSPFFLYCPWLFQSLGEHRFSIRPQDYLGITKAHFCAYMYSSEQPDRIRYFKLFSTYKPVHGLGKCCHNTDNPLSRHLNDEQITYNDIAVQLYAQFKFVLALENQIIPGYFTEKMINPLIANSLPIYHGDASVFRYINKERVIYIDDFADDQALLQYVQYLDTHPEEYEAKINQPIWVSPDTVEQMEQYLSSHLHPLLEMLN